MSVYTSYETAPSAPVTTPSTVDDDEVLPSSKTIREWARAQGMTVGQRGPLDPAIIARYMKSRNA